MTLNCYNYCKDMFLPMNYFNQNVHNLHELLSAFGVNKVIQQIDREILELWGQRNPIC